MKNDRVTVESLRLSLAAATFFFCAAAVFGGFGEWTNVGPPERVVALTVGGRQGTVYASTLNGLYRSSDHGESWQRINTTVNGTVTVDPTNAQTLFAGIGYGVSKSTDGGVTFTSSGIGLPQFCYVTRIAVAPSDAGTIYLCGCGVYRSTDGGAHWSRASLEWNVYSIAVDPSDPRRVVAGTDAFGIFLTADGGETWNAAVLRPPGYFVSDLQIDPLDPFRMYAAMGNYDVQRSLDRGETWTASTLAGFDPSAIAINPIDPKVLYVTAHDPPTPGGIPPPDVKGVYRSVDAGRTWTRFNPGQVPGQDLLAIDQTGQFVYSAGFEPPGVFAIDLGELSTAIPSLGEIAKLILILALAASGILFLRRR